MATANTTDTKPFGVAAFSAAGVGALIWLLPFGEIPFVRLNEHSPHILHPLTKATHIGPVDVVFILLIALALPKLAHLRHRRPIGVGLIGLGLLAAFAMIRLLFDPTPQGAVMVLRLIGAAAAVLLISDMSVADVKRAVIWSFALTALYQGVIGIAQTLVFDGGYGAVSAWGGWTAGHGTFTGQYTFAAFMVLSIAITLSIARFETVPPAIWVSVVVASASIGVTYGRSGVLSLIGIAVVFTVGAIIQRRPPMIGYAAAATVPFGVIASIVRTPWVGRASETVALNGSERMPLINRSLDVISSSPFIGVGPQGYASALVRIGLEPIDYKIVHSVPLLVTGEFGIAVGIFFTLWIASLGIVSLRTSVFAVAIFVAPIPHLLLDNLHWVFAAGPAMLGLWAAMLDFHARQSPKNRAIQDVSQADVASSPQTD